MKKWKYLVLAFVLGGCSAITTGTTQNIAVQTPMMIGAECSLTDSIGNSWKVYRTPGMVQVNKGDGPMAIVCTAKGYETANVSVDETLVGATLGNIILGGGIGFLVDAASGAAQKYPDSVTIWMKPTVWKSEENRKKWFSEKLDFEVKRIVQAETARCADEGGSDCKATAQKAAMAHCEKNNGENCGKL